MDDDAMNIKQQEQQNDKQTTTTILINNNHEEEEVYTTINNNNNNTTTTISDNEQQQQPQQSINRNTWSRTSLRRSPIHNNNGGGTGSGSIKRWGSFRTTNKRQLGSNALASELYRSSSFNCTSGSGGNVTTRTTNCNLDDRMSTTSKDDLYGCSSMTTTYSSMSDHDQDIIDHGSLLEDDVLDLNHKVEQLQQQVNILTSTTIEQQQHLNNNNINNNINNNNNNIIDDNSNVCLGSKKRIIFLDLLLQSTHLSGEPLTDKEIIDEVTNFMFAGHDTTSVQLSLLMYLLCEHPEIQNELYKEQCAILTDINGDPSFKQIQEMNYLERTIKESQRILPCVISFSRKMTADIQLKTNNLLLPKGCTASIFVYDVHHNPKIYENPEKFDPDRFLPENIRGRHPYAYIPFSAGPRNCLGQKFALLEMKTVMSNIIRNFKILPAYEDNGDKFKPIFRRYMLLTSLNGIQIRLESRR
uniref:Cytochrome P450 CYP4XF3 n=1 Tax=Chrysoperla zastrowi sillemi TaxID=482137 RepID=A0A9E8BWL7_9NEOP|nr:cytochrome P450 CYP4XF3 [Chrysoperla zastrowi sillemi]